MDTMQERLAKVKLDIEKLTTFIGQSAEKLKCRMCEYNHLKDQITINQAQEYVNSLK